MSHHHLLHSSSPSHYPTACSPPISHHLEHRTRLSYHHSHRSYAHQFQPEHVYRRRGILREAYQAMLWHPPEIDTESLQHSIFSIETALEQVAISRSRYGYPATRLQREQQQHSTDTAIFGPIRSLLSVVKDLTAQIDRWSQRNKLMDTTILWLEAQPSTCPPTLPPDFSTRFESIPDIDAPYVRSFPILATALQETSTRMSPLLKWLSQTLDSRTTNFTESRQPASPYDHIVPLEVLPPASPIWQLPLLQTYGSTRLADAGPMLDAKRDTMRRALFELRLVNAALDDAQRLADEQGSEAERLHEVWESWCEAARRPGGYHHTSQRGFDGEGVGLRGGLEEEFDERFMVEEEGEGDGESSTVGESMRVQAYEEETYG